LRLNWGRLTVPCRLPQLLTKIKMLTGVVEVGLFCHMAKAAYFGEAVCIDLILSSPIHLHPIFSFCGILTQGRFGDCPHSRGRQDN
jgi:hypothetical protein